MIVRARIVVTMDGPPIDNGAVRIAGNRIIEVRKFSEVATASDEIIDLGERVLLPGLINAHCHLDYTCLRGKIPRQTSFTDWIRAINAQKAKLTADDYLASINEGFAGAQEFGMTTIANLTAFPELIAKINPPVRTWWFAELIDVREPERTNEIVDDAIESLQRAENWGLAPHAPFTASENLFRGCQEIAMRENILLTTHLAESHEEMEMFRDASGALYQFMKGIGREMTDCGHDTPLGRFLGRLGETSLPNWIIAHLNELTENDFDLLAQMRRKFSIVHCPRSHAYFGHPSFQFEKLQALGFNICLGTDSLASNGDLSLFAEMRTFQNEFPDISPERILKMVTVNPARALQQENAFGKITRSFLADMIAISFTDSQAVYETILNFVGKVPWIMLHGKIVANP
jgi:cytosine/adenosine deaminase-related metal-dependent hydrolase